MSVVASVAFAQGTASVPPDLVLRSGTQEVLLDFVVRDKHHQQVKDIRPEEVEILEDGARQTLKSFSYRADTEGSSDMVHRGNQPNQSPMLDPLREINLVTMVFCGMSPLSRQQAALMAHDFLRTQLGPNTWIGVFTLNYHLAAVQPYTADIRLLSKAIDRAATGQYQAFAKESQELISRIDALQANPQQFQPLRPGSAEEVLPGRTAANSTLAAIDRVTLYLLFRQEGSRTIDGLRTLIREQARIPGENSLAPFGRAGNAAQSAGALRVSHQ